MNFDELVKTGEVCKQNKIVIHILPQHCNCKIKGKRIQRPKI